MLSIVVGTTDLRERPAPRPYGHGDDDPAPSSRAASDPLTTLDAWLACSSPVQGNYGLQNEGTQMSAYDGSMVSAGASCGFIVKVDVQPSGRSTTNVVVGAQGTVSGTVGEPIIKEIAFTDFG